MVTEKKLIYADSGKIAAEYMEKHLVTGDSDFLRGYLAGVKALAEGLENLPGVDAVPVVRCKDCKHYCDNEYGIGKICFRWDEWIYPNEDDFCSCGERRIK